MQGVLPPSKVGGKDGRQNDAGIVLVSSAVPATALLLWVILVSRPIPSEDRDAPPRFHILRLAGPRVME